MNNDQVQRTLQKMWQANCLWLYAKTSQNSAWSESECGNKMTRYALQCWYCKNGVRRNEPRCPYCWCMMAEKYKKGIERRDYPRDYDQWNKELLESEKNDTQTKRGEVI